jgi:hypothetical protein
MNSGVNNVTPMSSRRVASDCYAFLLLWLSWLRIWLQAVSLYCLQMMLQGFEQLVILCFSFALCILIFIHPHQPSLT